MTKGNWSGRAVRASVIRHYKTLLVWLISHSIDPRFKYAPWLEWQPLINYVLCIHSSLVWERIAVHRASLRVSSRCTVFEVLFTLAFAPEGPMAWRSKDAYIAFYALNPELMAGNTFRCGISSPVFLKNSFLRNKDEDERKWKNITANNIISMCIYMEENPLAEVMPSKILQGGGV